MSQSIGELLLSVDPSIGFQSRSDKAWHTRVPNPKRPIYMREWTEFNTGTLKRMSNGVFGEALEQRYDFRRCPEHGTHVALEFDAAGRERGLEFRLSKSVQLSVCCALKKTQSGFRERKVLSQIQKPGITMSCGQDVAYIKSRTGTDTSYQPAWAGVFRGLQDCKADKLQNYLPGISKLLWKVDLELLPQHVEQQALISFEEFGLPKKNDANRKRETKHLGLIYAIEQIYTYCYHAGCRYGYMLLENKLMVVRIGPHSPRPPNARDDPIAALDKHGLMEYKVIDFQTQDTSKLSASLALWWLHLLAAIDHRVDWCYPPLRKWKIANSSMKSTSLSAKPAPISISKHPKNSVFIQTASQGQRAQFSKRKQASMHNSGRRDNPTSKSTVQQSRYLDDQSLFFPEEPESDSDSGSVATRQAARPFEALTVVRNGIQHRKSSSALHQLAKHKEMQRQNSRAPSAGSPPPNSTRMARDAIVSNRKADVERMNLSAKQATDRERVDARQAQPAVVRPILTSNEARTLDRGNVDRSDPRIPTTTNRDPESQSAVIQSRPTPKTIQKRPPAKGPSQLMSILAEIK